MTEQSPYQPATVIRQIQARNFMEGPEHCREYIKTEKMWFGTSTLPPARAAISTRDTPARTRCSSCVKGMSYYLMSSSTTSYIAGDAIFIPEGLPHTLINVGEETAVLGWAGAPSA